MNKAMISRWWLVLICVSIAACKPSSDAGNGAVNAVANPSIDAQRLLAHIKNLASDDFGGRLPGTDGETKSVAYLTEQFKNMGLSPGNPDGSYVQAVPLVGINGQPELQIRVANKSLPLTYRQDYVATTSRYQAEVDLQDAPLLFVGYGVQAPEYDWDDYKGVDVKGKVLVMLINDPAIPDPATPDQLDAKLFKGKAMTYYGRWTYKYEIAEQLGAAGVLIVHETQPAGYGWNVVSSSWSGEAFELQTAATDARLALQGWLTWDKAQALFSQAGLDLSTLKTAALSKDFTPVALKASVTSHIHNTLRQVQSQNVLAKLPGSDAALTNDYVIYTAHWDHLGIDPTLSGDQIHNGAVDNASGVASLLEIARAFADATAKPKRSILFMAVTAEEQGLLGSKYYAEHPLYPLNKTLADINMDSMNVWGLTRDAQIIGSGQNDLEDTYTALAHAQQRTVIADDEPEKGRYFRSDQFSFAKYGVPGLYVKGGTDYVGHDAAWGRARHDAYTANDYHAPSDEVKTNWDLSGMVADTALLWQTGMQVANAPNLPAWQADSEFKAIRVRSLAAL